MTEAGGSTHRPGAPLDAIVVLGCEALLDRAGRLVFGALSKRLKAASFVYSVRGHGRTLVLVSGGRRWGTALEADVMAEELVHSGVPKVSIVRERCSMSTRDNARFAAAMLKRRGIGSAAVVTCAFHLPRALALFARAGVFPEPVPSGPEPQGHLPQRLFRWTRERALRLAG